MASMAGSNMDRRLVLISPDGESRTIPHPQASMMAQADEQGRLVFGCTGLYRYDPRTDRIQPLAEDCIPPIWGGCCASKVIVAGASTPDGTLIVYDRRKRRVVRTFSPLHPQSMYHYRAIETPDRRVLILSSLPRAVITLLSQDDYTIEQFIPDALAEHSCAHAAWFLGSDRLFIHTGGRSYILRYPGFEAIAEIPSPPGAGGWGRRTVWLNGRLVLWGWSANMPYALDESNRTWQPLLDEPIVPANPGEVDGYSDAFAALPDGSLCGVTNMGIFFRIPVGARRAETRRLSVTGRAAGAPLLVVPEIGKAYGSAHCLQQFWEVDLVGGEGRSLGQCGPSGGQVNDMFWDATRRRVMMGSYTTCTLLAYDPAAPGQYPANPHVVAKVPEGQMRPLQLVQDGPYAWMTSSPYYGTLGGALSRIDMRCGAMRVFRHLAENQTPATMLQSPDRRTIYLSMTIEGDCQSAVARAASAHLVVFDARRLRVVRSFAPFRVCPTLRLWAIMADGRILFADGPTFTPDVVLWTWDPRTDAISRVGLAPSGLRHVVNGPDGSATLWASGYDGVGPLWLGDPCRIEPVFSPVVANGAFDRMCKFLQWQGRRLWFCTGDELACIDVPSPT